MCSTKGYWNHKDLENRLIAYGYIRWRRREGAILVQSLIGQRLLAAGVGNALVLYDATNASHCPSHGTLMAFVRSYASDFCVALFGQRLSCGFWVCITVARMVSLMRCLAIFLHQVCHIVVSFGCFAVDFANLRKVSNFRHWVPSGRHMSCSMWQLLGWFQVCADHNEPHRRLKIYVC